MKRHWHVHSHIGNGYLCGCDSHYPYTAAERDEALREERNAWRDFKYQGERPESIRISGSIRSGGYEIEDTESLGWVRYVDSWPCTESECWEEIEA